jgi:Zn-dependent protease
MNDAELAAIQSQLEARYGRPLTDEERSVLASAVEEQRFAPLPPAPSPDDLRGYEPIHPGGEWRRTAKRVLGPIVAVVVALAKFGFIGLKFASIFIAVGGYALIWGWRFAVGFVALILMHELGHVIEARRQGLATSLPVFIPFFGAYVRHTPAADPFRAALVALAGPFWGGIGCGALLVVGRATSSPLVQALAYTGFLLNLINLVPVGFLDGGASWRAHRALRASGDGGRASLVLWLHAGLAGLLVLGMVAAHVHQQRL